MVAGEAFLSDVFSVSHVIGVFWIRTTDRDVYFKGAPFCEMGVST